MKIKTQDYNNITVVELQGELDCDVAELFQNTITHLLTKGKNGIVLNMSEMSFIDSDGLEKLLWVRDYCKENNCQLRLAGLDQNCDNILEITRLKSEFDRYEELSEAVKSFA